MCYKATNEAQLVAGLKNREQAAFTCFYDAYKAKMYGALLRIVRDEEVAQDLLQDSFIKAWKGIDRYEANRCKLFTWLFRLTQYTALDYLRSLKSRPVCDRNVQFGESKSIGYIDLYHSVPPSPIDGIDIRQQVERLDRKYRELLELTYFKGYTYRQAADLLQLPMGTASVRIRTGLQLLKGYLTELAHDDAV